MAVYLGERYVPQADAQLALEQSEHLRRTLAEAGASGVHLLSSTFVANEEWAFDLFEAESAAQVEQVYARGRVAVERVTEAVHLKGAHQ